MEKTNTHSPDTLSRILIGSAFVLLILTSVINITGFGFERGGSEPPEPTIQEYIPEDVPEDPPVVLPQTISLSLPFEYISPGATMQISAEVFPSDAGYSELIWTSSNAAVASVDSSGVVTANGRGQTYVTVRTDAGASAYVCVSVVEPVTVYLSPSSQTDKAYPVGSTTESEQCMLIAEHCRDRLNLAGIKTVVCEDNSLSLNGRARAAKQAKADYYISIHSGTSEDAGLRVAFNRRMSDSVRLSFRINDSLTGLVNNGKRGELFSGLNNNIKEIEYLEEREIPAVYIEVQNHKTAENAQWIIDNSQQIGYSIADGILRFLLTKSAD